MKQQLLISNNSLIERLFQFSEIRHKNQYEKFFIEMLEGILGSKSTLIANIARFLDEPIGIKQTADRLSRLLSHSKMPWEELRERSLEVGSQLVGENDIIAFDPGDLVKKYAQKMGNLYRVHDGSTGECGNGYEDFSVEAIQWKNGKRMHVPLYQTIINANCKDYISQNDQIAKAVYAIRDHIGNKGIWVFDRGHDRSMLYKKIFFVNSDMRWIVRAKENRTVRPLNEFYAKVGDDDGYTLLMEMVKRIPLQETPMRITFPSTTGKIHLGWERVKLVIDGRVEQQVTIVVAHDKRNAEPVVLITSLPIASQEEALITFGFYLERWRKEEGYRFTKSFLNIEEIRVMNFEAIQNMAFLVHLVYFWVTLFHRSAPQKVEQLCDELLVHERPIQDISFRYYRVAQLMRRLLNEQKDRMHTQFSMTQVA